ncbi:MAG: hypothetical protein ACR2NR_07435 [Solirubrobacteraceae bacterium]
MLLGLQPGDVEARAEVTGLTGHIALSAPSRAAWGHAVPAR